MVPIPHAASFAELNARLLECCRRRLNDRLRGHAETIGERLVRDQAALLPLPATPYEACEKKAAHDSSPNSPLRLAVPHLLSDEICNMLASMVVAFDGNRCN